MPTERVTEIQTALIRHGYQSGEPTGKWDAQTAAAMQKLQADHGWQTKITPDSRALILLGLGPEDTRSAPRPSTQPSPGATGPAKETSSSAASGRTTNEIGVSGPGTTSQTQIFTQTQQQ
jgi:hypothetical protein